VKSVMEKRIVVVISNCVSYCVCELGLVNLRVNKRSCIQGVLELLSPVFLQLAGIL